jgi:hypothetical protein
MAPGGASQLLEHRRAQQLHKGGQIIQEHALLTYHNFLAGVQARLMLQIDGHDRLQQPRLALQACLVSSEAGQGGRQLLHLALILAHLLLW